MKEELQTKLVEILGSIQTVAGKAGDFAMTQLPDIAQQYVVYGRATTLIAVLGSMAAIGFAFWCMRCVRREFGKYEDWMDCSPALVVPVGIVGGLCGLLGGISMVENLQAAALVWFAPKVWLLKELAAMVK